ncbi:DYW_deaminase domain-containing protein [Psidium guajava]|nr:DYW_deaminase domain-containing protein [Psidium guajava]
MNFAKVRNISTLVKPSLIRRPSFTPTVTLSILETHLGRCHNLKQFNQILSQMILTGYIRDTYAASKLLKFSTDAHFVHVNYSFCVFNYVENPNGFSWNTMMRAFVQNDSPQSAVFLYKLMLNHNVGPDNYTYPIIVQACSLRLSEFEGKQVHDHVLKLGFDSDVYVRNTLINLYSVHENMEDARKLFDESIVLDTVSWNTILAGYVQAENTGRVVDAYELFSQMEEKDMVSWSALISCYEQNGMYDKALVMFKEMAGSGVRVDEVVMISILSACAHLSVGETGKLIHGLAGKLGLESYVNLQNALIHMYSIYMYMKCGCVENALDVFQLMENKSVSTWNAMILGLAMNGLVGRSLNIFLEMKNCGVTPNDVTFIGVLGACRHMGLVDEGCFHFDSMVQEYKIEPNVKHYGCMVDLLGRAGKLKEAEELIESMPMAPDVSTWGALLGGCRKHGDIERGERVGRKLVELQPDHDGFHVLLSNLYASKGNWHNVLEIRGIMEQRGVMKTPGCSMIEANGVIHEFLAGDKTHPQREDTENKLDEITKKLKMEGYVPDMNEVFLEIDEEEKETTLLRHSEKLAIAFGLLNIPPEMPIRIIKNLRICNDCHTVAKFTSKAYNRDIIIRDRHRFHHFKQGNCSCMDFW